MRVSGIVDFYSPSLPTPFPPIPSTWKRIAFLKRSFGVEHFSIQLRRSGFQEGRSETRELFLVDRIAFTLTNSLINIRKIRVREFSFFFARSNFHSKYFTLNNEKNRKGK